MKLRIELSALLIVGIAPFYLNGLYNSPLATTNRSWFWGVEVATWIVMPALFLIVGFSRGLFTSAELGLTAKVRGVRRPWAFWVLMLIVPYALFKLDVCIHVWAHETLPAGWTLPPFLYMDVIPPAGPETGGYRLLALAHLCLTAGIVEELYYRAVMDRLFPRGWVAGTGYVLISSLVFAGAHWEGGLPNLVEAFTIGIFAATVFRLSGTIWPLIVGHIVTDWYWFSGGPAAG